MLNDIIIDKLRIALPITSANIFISEYGMDLKEFKNRLERFYMNNFPEKAFKITKRYSYLFIEFNPTRYSNNKIKHDDVNLQMISNEKFLRLFEAMESILKGITRKFVVVELDFTKNILLENKVSDYVDMLLNIKPSRMHPVSFGSKYSKSVNFSTLTNDNKDKQYTGNRVIKFYDKTAELKHIKGKNISKLVPREPLKDKEKARLIDLGIYSEADNTLDLSNANLLRVELEYKLSKNLVYFAQTLNRNETKSLHLRTLMNELRENTSTESFDTFFATQLKNFIFKHDINEEIKQGDNRKHYSAALSKLSFNKTPSIDSELYYNMHLLDAIGVNSVTAGKKFDIINKGIIKNPLYRELYENLFSNETILSNGIISELNEKLEEINKDNKNKGSSFEEHEEREEDEEMEDTNAEGEEEVSLSVLHVLW